MTDDAGRILRLITEGTAAATGERFFVSLVCALAEALDVRLAFVTRFSEDREFAIPLAACLDGKLVKTKPFAVRGTPCELVLGGEIVGISERIVEQFPEDRGPLEALGAQSYLAIPLKQQGGQVLGHLAAIDVHPRDWHEADLGILRIFGARAAAEVERRAFEEQLESARDAAEKAKLQAEAANKSKNDFLANMSHEVRTQLNGILGYTQLLSRNSRLDSDQQDCVAHIDGCGHQLLVMINDVLDIAKMEAGRLELNQSSVQLSKLLEDIVSLVRLRAQSAGIGFIYEPPKRWPPAALWLDERKLRQILLNLLTNAVKFTPRGEVRLSVQCTAVSDEKWQLVFSVRDTGIGILKRDRERIFEPFFQAESVWQSGEGAGLGLAIAHRLAGLMGGDIQVTSRLGKGSKFTLAIGAANCRSSQEVELPGSMRRVIGYRGARRKILVAEDKGDSRQYLKQILEPMGFVVLEAANGSDALKIATEERPDLILMDLVMPGMDGFEAVRRLRAHPELADSLPIVAVSASAFDQTRIESQIAGCNAFITKPVTLEEITRVIEQQLRPEWIYSGPVRGKAAQQPESAASEEIRENRFAELYDLACRGDVGGLRAKINEMSQAGTVQIEFVQALTQSASRFDMKAIREQLKPLVEGTG